ncbi:beta-ketoacyl synthase N-terminal-like domain-containing protein [Pseudophaeobacter leonis]|uniref:beta-ketoacyl synthase N-terminal-like domain-containing protein n=1 Tax=Pseudophaeobacter leonis TaxID=1144477 RepID=UPI0009F18545|nr:beta-ketoacyl synthase N-terminal-like domain-containing protein [Pseudophaeobacter leonis]
MSAAGFDPELSATAFDDSAIAVVGMACRLPGAPDIAAFWDLLAQGRDVISRFSAAELTAVGLTPDQYRAADYVPAKGVLQDADCFDAGFFGLAPSDAALMDPQQRVFIECAHSALEHAGYGGAPQGAQVGVFGGSSRRCICCHTCGRINKFWTRPASLAWRWATTPPSLRRAPRTC